MSSIITCVVPASLKEQLKKFRFRKAQTTAALILKLNRDTFELELDEQHDAIQLADLQDELPDTQPRFIVVSYAYQQADGRLSFPLVFFYWSPRTVKPETHMFYAGAKVQVMNECDCGKAYDIRDVAEFNDDWLRDKLSFFK